MEEYLCIGGVSLMYSVQCTHACCESAHCIAHLTRFYLIDAKFSYEGFYFSASLFRGGCNQSCFGKLAVGYSWVLLDLLLYQRLKIYIFGRNIIRLYDITLKGIKINNNYINIHRNGIEDGLVSICI